MLERFNIYAPFVQHLDVLDRHFEQTITDNDKRISYLLHALQRPLLPNLTSLTCQTERIDQSDDIVHWTKIFLHPSLIEIRTVAFSLVRSCWLRLSPARDLLLEISQRCPKLETLHILPGERRESGDNDEGQPQGEQQHPFRYVTSSTSLHPYLPSFVNLRRLVGSPAMLSPHNLAALGGLPQLNSIKIQAFGTFGNARVPISNIDLPESSFPALRHLELYRLDPATVLEIWGISPVVKCLDSVIVTYHFIVEDGGPHMIVAFLQALQQCSPNVTDLTLSFFDAIMGCPSAMNLLHTIPLRRISFPTHSTCSPMPLLKAIPTVQELCIADHLIQLSDLQSIAIHLPELRYLEVDLDLNEPNLDLDFRLPERLFPVGISLERAFMRLGWFDADPHAFDTVARFVMNAISLVLCYNQLS
jgi:hypothetical protein